MKLLMLSLAAILTLMPGIARGRDYYVATNGDDGHPGTLEQPLRTLNHGVTQLRAGDTLVVRAGVYHESLRSKIPSGTSWDARVTIKAHPGEKAVLRPDQGAGLVMEFWKVNDEPQQYIVIDGLVLDASNVEHDCVKIYSPAHHLRFIRCEITGAANQGILGRADGCEFLDLLVHDNGIREGTHGLYLGGTGARIEGCRIYNNFGNGLRNDGLSDSIIARNRIHHNGRGYVSPPYGYNALEFYGTGSVMYHNLVYANRCQTAVRIRVQGPDRSKVYHNTVVGNLGAGMRVGTYRDGVVHVANNLIVGHQADVGLDNTGTGPESIFENNLLFGNRLDFDNARKTGTWRNNNVANPQFVDRDGHDYRLWSASPARDAGVPLQGLSKDFSGADRVVGNRPDIGAYEFDPTDDRLLAAAPPAVDAGPDMVTTMSEPVVTLQGAVKDVGRSAGGATVFWKMLYGPAPVMLASPNSLSTTATFSAPGGYLLKLFADDGNLSAGDMVLVFVHPNLESGAPLRVEAEHMLLDHYKIESSSSTSGGKYVVKPIGMDCDVRILLPLSAGDYDVVVGYFDGEAGQAWLRLILSRGDATDPDDFKVTVQEEWKCDRDLPGIVPSKQTAVRQKVAEDLPLQTGDALVVGLRNDSGEPATVDYIEFIPKPSQN